MKGAVKHTPMKIATARMVMATEGFFVFDSVILFLFMTWKQKLWVALELIYCGSIGTIMSNTILDRHSGRSGGVVVRL